LIGKRTISRRASLIKPGEIGMTCVLVSAIALVALAQNSPGQDATIKLAVRPMPAPKPALKYQLLPEVGELNPGNSAQNYVKCFMEQRNFFYGEVSVADRARYQRMPLAELADLKLGGYGGSALGQADWAARLNSLDWQDLQRVQNGGLDRLPPELGPLQLLATALQVRFRIEVAGRRFDQAVRTAKTMFALARHLGEYPSEIADMVGLSVAHLGLETLTEMVQQPGCPNLYWALTDLPSPLVDLRKGVQGDRSLVSAELRVLRDDAPMTEPELEQFVARLSGVLNFTREQSGSRPLNVRARLAALTKDPDRVRAAGHRLVEAGCAEGVVKKLRPSQIILLDERREYELARDERIKLLFLPLWQIAPCALSLTRDQGECGLFTDLLPNIVDLRRAQARLEQQIALLRHVEAIRLHAAGSAGTLPSKLSDLSVPLPLDPVTGLSFIYAVEGSTAHLRGGTDGAHGLDVHYEVTVLK
jgi:hypothetical protein